MTLWRVDRALQQGDQLERGGRQAALLQPGHANRPAWVGQFQRQDGQAALPHMVPGHQFRNQTNGAVNKIIVTKEVSERLLKLGLEPEPMSVDAFNKEFLKDRDLMNCIVKDVGLSKEN